ncbi:MAG: hypothetical protein ACRENQ_10035 [Gemmatimonadaceae bacterium]
MTTKPARRTASPPIVRVIAHEYAYQAPDSIRTGPTTFRLVSHGHELHFMLIARIAVGHTAAELFDAIIHDAPAPWITSLGGVGTVAPGDSAAKTIDLTPGHYAMWCDIETKDGIPHFKKRMFRAFTVVGPPNGAAMPHPDVTVDLTEYAFTMPASLSTGRHVVDVKNVGTQNHMALLWRLNVAVSADSVVRWIDDPAPRTDHPVMMMGGVSDLSPGQRVQMVVDLAPGTYILICLDDDVHDHRPHFRHGMVREFAVLPPRGP